MSDSEDGEHQTKAKKDVMPEYKMRFTDMPPKLVENTIKRKKFYNLLFFLVVGKCTNQRFDKDFATAIVKAIAADPELCDDCAGWHVIVGKSFSSAIQYKTKWVLFFDLLGDINKSVLIFKTS